MTTTLQAEPAAALARIREEAAACELARQLTPAAVDAVRATGVFSMTMGRRLGGPELDPIAQIELIEAISSADASAGWCSMIGSDGGYATAYLDESVARQMYPDLDVPTALNANPSGQAKQVAGGYAVTGRWAFGSGSTHSAWLFLHCLVLDDAGGMRMTDAGIPDMVMVGVPASDVTIVDTWRTTGLAGSGSHDVQVADVFVPEERTFSLLHGTPADEAPLYSWRWMFFVNLAAVPLGLGRAAIDEAVRVAAAKFDMATMTTASEDPLVGMAVAKAEALVGSARSYLLETVDAFWNTVLRSGDLAPPWARFRIANTNAFHAVKDAVGLLYEALGTSGVYNTSPLDRHYRDIATMTQHVLVQPKTWVPSGRVLLGLDHQQLMGF